MPARLVAEYLERPLPLECSNGLGHLLVAPGSAVKLKTGLLDELFMQWTVDLAAGLIILEG